jgi:hypothetical protein
MKRIEVLNIDGTGSVPRERKSKEYDSEIKWTS